MLIIRNNIFYFIRNFVKLFRKTSVDRSAAESSAADDQQAFLRKHMKVKLTHEVASGS